MDWLRRNWPDLIIGVALVAVVALIVVTLLSGGSLASLVRRNNPPEVPITQTTPQGTVQTGASTDSSTPQNGTAAGEDSANAGVNNTDSNSPDPNNPDGVDVFVPGIPGRQAGAASSASGGVAQASTTPGADGTQAGSLGSGGIAQSSAQDGAANSGPLPEATQRGGFRVAAGAVDSRDSAASLAESYRDADYTVTVEQQSDLYLLWIGPYATRVGADRVAARLQTDGLVPDALVYTYRGPGNSGPDNNSSDGSSSDSTSPSATATTGDTAAGTAGTAGTTAGAEGTNDASDGARTASVNDGSTSSESIGGEGSNADSGTATDATTSAATPSDAAVGADASGQQYLQVGAFVSDEGAQPLREQLEALGFSVTRRESETGLVRLLVGPFGDAQLAQTQTRLQGEGIPDAFPVAP